jgi:hypothetical protein
MANSCIRRVADTLWEPQNARNYGVGGTMPFLFLGTAYFGAVSCLFQPFWKISVKLVLTGKNRICIIEECAFLIISVINTYHESLQ